MNTTPAVTCPRYREQGLHATTFLKNALDLVLQIFLYLESNENNTTSDWLNHMVVLYSNLQILEKKTKNILVNGW